jgi:hypothetical protein
MTGHTKASWAASERPGGPSWASRSLNASVRLFLWSIRGGFVLFAVVDVGCCLLWQDDGECLSVIPPSWRGFRWPGRLRQRRSTRWRGPEMPLWRWRISVRGTQQPAQVCADAVRAADVYLAVMGFRYGPPVADHPELAVRLLRAAVPDDPWDNPPAWPAWRQLLHMSWSPPTLTAPLPTPRRRWRGCFIAPLRICRAVGSSTAV